MVGVSCVTFDIEDDVEYEVEDEVDDKENL